MSTIKGFTKGKKNYIDTISQHLKYSALSDCKVFQFAKIDPENINKKWNDEKLILKEFGVNNEFHPSNLFPFDITNPVQMHLIETLASTLDAIAILALKSTEIKTIPISRYQYQNLNLLTNKKSHSAMLLNSQEIPYNFEVTRVNSTHCQIITDYLGKASVPYYNNTSYIGIGNSKLLESIERDTEFRIPVEYLTEGDILFSGERGKIGRVRWIDAGKTVHLSDHMYGEGVVFGDAALIAQETVPVSLRIIDNKFGGWFGVVECGLASNTTVVHIQ